MVLSAEAKARIPDEFLGLGGAVWIANGHLARARLYDDERTFVLEVPTPSGEWFEICFDLDYAGIRLFTNCLMEQDDAPQDLRWSTP